MLKRTLLVATSLGIVGGALALASDGPVSDSVIEAQRSALAKSTDGAGFGPQSPRDIDTLVGENTRFFSAAPSFKKMNLCNIHFHKNAEHRGGEFTSFAGNGDGKGYDTGYKYSGELTAAELAPIGAPIGDKGHGGMVPGDTIEVHYVHTTAQVMPGPTLGACLSEAIGNPQLRVETQVMALVNDRDAMEFVELAKVGKADGFYQAVNIPTDKGAPVQYDGSTTGPGYNEKDSPFEVSWSVRPKVVKVDIRAVDAWMKGNIFNEDYAHGVRNPAMNRALLSPIGE
ncbi:MAG: delta-class carbonic anhydrase [Pseudomonadota bacterium]